MWQHPPLRLTIPHPLLEASNTSCVYISVIVFLFHFVFAMALSSTLYLLLALYFSLWDIHPKSKRPWWHDTKNYSLLIKSHCWLSHPIKVSQPLVAVLSEMDQNVGYFLQTRLIDANGFRKYVFLEMGNTFLNLRNELSSNQIYSFQCSPEKLKCLMWRWSKDRNELKLSKGI